MNIPEEAIEAAAKAMSANWKRMHTNEALGFQRMLAEVALESAAPFIAAQALRDEAGRLAQFANIHPATNLWSVVDSMRNRAARMESRDA